MKPYKRDALALMKLAHERKDVEVWRFAKRIYLFGHHCERQEQPETDPPEYAVGGDNEVPRHYYKPS